MPKVTIKVGTGGTQVFEAEDWEKLTRLLATAQLNATRLIRKQNRQLTALRIRLGLPVRNHPAT